MTALENEKILVRLETKMDALTDTVEDVKDKLYGNGKPGIIVDQILQSKQIDELLSYSKRNADNIEKLNLVAAPTWLGKNWKTILVILTVFFLIIHSIIPADVSIWTLIGKFFTG